MTHTNGPTGPTQPAQTKSPVGSKKTPRRVSFDPEIGVSKPAPVRPTQEDLRAAMDQRLLDYEAKLLARHEANSPLNLMLSITKIIAKQANRDHLILILTSLYLLKQLNIHNRICSTAKKITARLLNLIGNNIRCGLNSR